MFSFQNSFSLETLYIKLKYSSYHSGNKTEEEENGSYRPLSFKTATLFLSGAVIMEKKKVLNNV